MVSTGGQTRPTIGNPDPNTVLASGVVISGTVNLPGTVNISGTVNIPGSLVVSGGANLTSVTGLTWLGADYSGITNLLSGVSCAGFMQMNMSGQSVYVAYWVSA